MKKFDKAIKRWFLDKNDIRNEKIFNNSYIKRETDKAILIEIHYKYSTKEMWIPKSVIIDYWEKDVSPFAYHDYLVGVARKAYDEGKLFKKHIIKSGRNVYAGDSFLHQKTSKELKSLLDEYNVTYLDYKDWQKQ